MEINATNCPHQKVLRKGRSAENGRAYSVTKCAASHVSLTADPLAASALIYALFWMDARDRLSLGAFVVMPDHYHLVMIPGESETLTSVMHTIGFFVAKEINRIYGKTGQVWQRGYYERAIRESEDIREVSEYIHANPVRRGLVERPEHWPYSSVAPEYAARIRWNLFL